jgi:hypothetical protein
MIVVTYLPLCVTLVLRGMPGLWKSRHRVILCWLVFMPALYPGRKTLEELARWSPAQVTVWRFRRVLTASYWNVHLLVVWRVYAYQHRRPVEQINRELKTDLGLDEHQVSTEEGRIEKSFGVTILAYLLLSRACHQEILPEKAWSISQLQHAFRLQVITNQIEHNVKTRLTKARKAV